MQPGGLFHTCKVASGNAHEFGLSKEVQTDVLDVASASVTCDDAENGDPCEIESLEEDPPDGVQELGASPEPKWSRESSILWTIQEARWLISQYELRSDVFAKNGDYEKAPKLAVSKPKSGKVLALDNLKGALKFRKGPSSGKKTEVNGSSDSPNAPIVLRTDMLGTSSSMDSPVPDASEDEDGGFFSEAKSGLIPLLICSLCYLHCSATGFALPAILPVIGSDISLTDAQGALLTTGYTLLYAAALIPMGLLADRVDRPKLLAAGVLLWSGLNSLASRAGSFSDLMLLRIGFASAQATQNPICMSMIPELFPKNRSTAMAIYNCAIYMGRALSFGFLMILANLGVSDAVGVKMVSFENLDLDIMSILYTTGDKVAVLPVYDYNASIIFSQMEESGWRDLLFWLGVPGVFIAALLLITVRDPRSKYPNAGARVLTKEAKALRDGFVRQTATMSASVADAISDLKNKSPLSESDETTSVVEDVKMLLARPSFQATTFAAAMNDVGGWGLIAWQAIFYERVFSLPSDQYALILAAIIPIGGVFGGVGGGLASDWLSKTGNRFFLTFGASMISAPLIYWSLQSDSASDSFVFLLFGFALSECWRAPAAVMIREVAPASMGSTASAVHLCIRNIFAGAGPIGIALLAEPFGLQNAMTLIPFSYMVSALGFLLAEVLIKLESPVAKTQS